MREYVQYKIKNGVFTYCYKNTVDGFNIPVRFLVDEKEVWLQPTKDWQELTLPEKDSKVQLDENFYIDFNKK